MSKKCGVPLMGFVFFSVIEPKSVPWWAHSVNLLIITPMCGTLHIYSVPDTLSSSVLLLILKSQQALR